MLSDSGAGVQRDRVRGAATSDPQFTPAESTCSTLAPAPGATSSRWEGFRGGRVWDPAIDSLPWRLAVLKRITLYVTGSASIEGQEATQVKLQG